MLKQEIDIKTLNARTQKWRQMIKNGLFSDLHLLKKRVRKGIPSGMRMIIWPKLLNLQQFRKQSKQSYEELIKQKSVIQKQIRLDIPRTYTEQKAQLMRVSLFNVLKALSLVYPQLGYCQGMNHLSMKILETVTDDTGFQIMNYLIRHYRNISWNYKNPSSTGLQNYVLDRLLEKYLPKIKNKMKEQGIVLEAFTTRWFITLYSSTLPIQLFCRILDCFFLEGYKIIYQTALSLLKTIQYQILHNQTQQNLMLLMSKKQYQELNHNKFINTLYSFNVSQQLIQKLQEQFLMIHQDEVISWQQESQNLYQIRIQQKKKMEEGGYQQIEKISQTQQEEQLIEFDGESDQ